MPYLVDGNNLIGQTPGLRLHDEKSRQELIRRLCAYQHRKGGQYTVHFDGEPERGPSRPESRLGGVTIRYSGHGVTADESIIRVVKRSAAPGECIVVSSDRQLRTECKNLGAKLMSCSELNREMGRQLAQPFRSWEKPLSPNEIREWLKIFGES